MGSLWQAIPTVRLGLKSVWMHKLRSALTVLGVVFGVCSVISMLAIGEGASREVLDQIRQLGSQNILIQSVKPPDDPSAQTSSRGRRGPPSAVDYGLRYADAELLHETLPSAKVIVPIKAIASAVSFKDREQQANVLGTVPWYPETANIQIVRGRFICDLDIHRYENVCVLGEEMARSLFYFRDPVGEHIRIGSNAYRVVGVVKEGGGGGTGDLLDLPSQNADVFVPLSTLRAYEGDLFIQRQSGGMSSEYVELHQINVAVNSIEEVMATGQVIERLLARRHPDPDYKVNVPLQLLQQARRTQAIFSIVLGSIAAISLLVGGIGIMNIMLASVTERTREIGIRRAMGARRRDIMLQFLVECLILSVGGGLLGMALGAGIPTLVTAVSEYFGDRLVTVLTPWAFILSFGVSAMIGIVFGLYPARRAALLDPIDALRHE